MPKDAKTSVRTPAFCRARRDAYGGCRHSGGRIKHAEDCRHNRVRFSQTWNERTSSWDKVLKEE